MIRYYLCYLTGVGKSLLDNISNITCFSLPLGLLIGFSGFLQEVEELPNRSCMLDTIFGSVSYQILKYKPTARTIIIQMGFIW
jgi:hypothetical protein